MPWSPYLSWKAVIFCQRGMFLYCKRSHDQALTQESFLTPGAVTPAPPRVRYLLPLSWCIKNHPHMLVTFIFLVTVCRLADVASLHVSWDYRLPPGLSRAMLLSGWWQGPERGHNWHANMLQVFAVSYLLAAHCPSLRSGVGKCTPATVRLWPGCGCRTGADLGPVF